MARKRSEQAAMPEVAEPEPKLKPVRLDLEPPIHRLLRLLAADDEMSMAAYARTALVEHLTAEAKKRGIKR